MPCILTGILCRRPARPAVATPQGAATPFRADGGHRRLARGNAPQGAAPLSRHSPTAPLPGEPLGEAAVRKASPARGGVTEGDGGVHCRFAPQVSCKPRQNPALCFAGDDLRAKSRHFVPVALRNAACGRQCLHRPGKPAMPQTPSGGRKRPPYIAAARGWQCINASLPPGPLAGRWDHRSLRGGAVLHNRHPPTMPVVPGSAACLPCIVGRAFTPAGRALR